MHWQRPRPPFRGCRRHAPSTARLAASADCLTDSMLTFFPGLRRGLSMAMSVEETEQRHSH
eukprot:42831-Eustigmatos_ZCMA.PRE.1